MLNEEVNINQKYCENPVAPGSSCYSEYKILMQSPVKPVMLYWPSYTLKFFSMQEQKKKSVGNTVLATSPLLSKGK